MLPFQQRRRQQFLYEDLYIKTRKNQLAILDVELENKRVVDSLQENSSVHHFLYLELFWI